VSLDPEVLAIVDRLAASEGSTRSAVMERWLRQIVHRAKVSRLEEETASYYSALTPAERDEDAALAGASGDAAVALDFDHRRTTPRRTRRTGKRRRR